MPLCLWGRPKVKGGQNNREVKVTTDPSGGKAACFVYYHQLSDQREDMLLGIELCSRESWWNTERNSNTP